MSIGFILCTLFFAAKLVVIYLNVSFDLLPLAVDAIQFDETASLLAFYFDEIGFRSTMGLLREIYIETPSFTVPLGFLYYLISDTYVVGFVFNALCASVTTYNIYRISKHLYDDVDVALSAVIIFSLLPYATVLGTWLYREPVVWMLISAFFWLILLYESKRTVPRLAMLTLVMAYAVYIRDENIFLLLPVYLFTLMGNVRLKWSTFLSACMVLGLVFFMWALIDPATISIYTKKIGKLVSVEHIAQRANKHSYQAGAYLTGLKIDSYLDLVYYLPFRAISFLMVPFPWAVISRTGFFSLIDNLIMLPVYFCFIKNLIRLHVRSKRFFYCAGYYIFFGIMASGLIQGNVAGAQRHRLQFTILILALSGIDLIQPVKDTAGWLKRRMKVFAHA